MKKYFALLLCIILITGCGRKPAQTPDINILMDKVNTNLMAGATNVALSILSDALKDTTYSQFRGQLFSQTLDIMLAGNRIDEAKARFMATLGKDEELTRAGFNVLSRYYQGSGGPDAFDSWTSNMMNQPLPKDLLEQAFTWQISISQSKGNLSRHIALIPAVIQKFDTDARRRILLSMISIQVNDKKYDQAYAMIEAIEKKCEDDITLKYSLASQRVQLFFTQERWQEGTKIFQDTAEVLPDNQLKDCFLQVLAICGQKEQLDLIDKLCEVVLDNQKSKAASIQVAASQWMEMPAKRKDPGSISGRLEALKTKGIPSGLLCDLFQAHFYTVIKDGTKEQVAAMNNFAGKLLPDIKDDEQYGRIQTLILDGTFIQEDYEGIIKLLEAGIKGKTQIWLDMLSNKAKAHKYLKDGNPKEAVQYFRKFMENLAKWGKTEQDPTTAMIYTPDMCLGFNAKRIGDILTKAGENAEAEKAYADAKEYFKKASANLAENSKEMQFINKQLAGIPANKN